MKKTKKPFFAKFLENQIKSEDKKSAKGGAAGGPKITKINYDYDVTMKYPSDGDEDFPTW